MATYLYSTQATATFDGATSGTPPVLTAGHQAVFTTADYLNYDTESVTAASLAITGTTTAVITGAKTYTLTGFNIKQISSTNFVFADGSKLQIGDGTTSTTNDDSDNVIIGTDYNDYFDGLSNTSSILGTLTTAAVVGGDTISYALATSGVTVNLTAGTTSGGAGVDTLSNIENVIGSAFSDTLTASATGSKLDGGVGIDTLIGGLGNDTFVVTAGDTVTEASSSGGTDLVISSVDYALPANVENLTLTGGAAQGVGNGLTNLIIGTSGNNVLDGGSGADTMIGGSGNDTYLVDNSSDVIIEVGNTVASAATAGIDMVLATASYALPTVSVTNRTVLGVSQTDGGVENLRLMGTANIDGTGNALNNIIYANSGDNALSGGTGTDTLSYQYGTASGVYVSLAITAAQNTIDGSTGGSISTVVGASGTDTITGFENLTGSRYSDSLTGTSGSNVLTGGMGNDTLTSGGGTDTLDGGNGNDTYVVTTTTGITFADSAGIDTLQSSGTATIANSSVLENLTLTGSGNINGTGSSANNTLIGNSGNNILDGGDGSDVLKGGGTNSGTDVLKGGLGNDTYLLTSASTETITELDSAGTDLVIADVAGLTLAANVENLTIGSATTNATTGALSAITAGSTGRVATGNLLANVITGGTGADTLSGGAGNDTLIAGTGVVNDSLDGGTGNDVMTGGDGDDTYVVDSSTDVITETSGTNSGTDTVQASITYTLGTNVENLLLTGSTDINGTGNSAANTITGNSGANTLSGSTGNDTLNGAAGNDILNGGSGNDSMSGGANDDTYIVDSTSDVVVEAASEGTDTVQASVTYTISDADVENLTLTGSATINGTGNASANTLTGNTANNTLDGSGGADIIIGGAGKDSLTGGTGADTFVYNATSESAVANADVITDFTTTSDKIDVSAIFGGSGPSSLLTAFTSGGSPEVKYASGIVSFDVDGNGTADFAITLTGTSTPVFADFTF